MLSHRSAGALWGITGERDEIEISVRRSFKQRRSGIRVRGRPSILDEDVVADREIPVTGPTLALVDLGTVLGPAALERAVNEADKGDLVSSETLRASLESYAGKPGVRAVRTLLDRHAFRLSDSELERAFRPIATAAGLPPPHTQSEVNGFRVDFFWPDLGLIVETDGLRYHRTPQPRHATSFAIRLTRRRGSPRCALRTARSDMSAPT